MPALPPISTIHRVASTDVAKLASVAKSTSDKPRQIIKKTSLITNFKSLAILNIFHLLSWNETCVSVIVTLAEQDLMTDPQYRLSK